MEKIESNYSELLESIRKDPKLLEELCSIRKDSNKPPKDSNEENRLKVGIAVYNDFQESDEFIIKYLFDKEVESLKQVVKKYHDSFLLISYLYTLNKSAEKVIDFYELKMLNYDTFSGFEREHLLVGGVSNTFKFLETLEPNYANRIKQEIGEDELKAIFSDDQIESWLQYKKSEFIKYKYPENLDEQIDFNVAIKDKIKLELIVDKWHEQVTDWNKKTLSKLLAILNVIKNDSITISYLNSKISFFDGELLNHAILKKYLDSLIAEKKYQRVYEIVKQKIEAGLKRIYEASIFFYLVTIIEESNEKILTNECIKLLKLNRDRLNQNILNKLEDIGNAM